MSRIPANARIVELDRGMVAVRLNPGSIYWRTTMADGLSTSEEVLQYLSEGFTVLATFADASPIHEVVGDAPAFIATANHGGKRVHIRYLDGTWTYLEPSTGGAELEDLAKHVDLSSVVALAPRGKG